MEKLYQRRGQSLTLRESIDLYLKPQNSSRTGLHCLMVLLDSLLSVTFLICILTNVLFDKFSTVNEKVIEGLIGLALPVVACLYVFMDGSRFLESRFDKALYLISCTAF